MGGQFIVYSFITQFATHRTLEVRLLPTEFVAMGVRVSHGVQFLLAMANKIR
jgi:hypothetical protein